MSLVCFWINGTFGKGRLTQTKFDWFETLYSGGAINPKKH